MPEPVCVPGVARGPAAARETAWVGAAGAVFSGGEPGRAPTGFALEVWLAAGPETTRRIVRATGGDANATKLGPAARSDRKNGQTYIDGFHPRGIAEELDHRR